jgi:hypothetical protein
MVIQRNSFTGCWVGVTHEFCCAMCAALQDFVTLQFIPPGTDLQPILPVLAKVFDQVGDQTAGVGSVFLCVFVGWEGGLSSAGATLTTC